MHEPDSSEPPSQRLAVVVLAAGQGTRMRSHLPKVLHPVAGRPMLGHVLEMVARLGALQAVVVTSHLAGDLRPVLGEIPSVEQAEQLGTAHAVVQARSQLEGKSDVVLVVYGDTPLLRHETAARLLATLRGATLAVLTVELDDPTGYGRVVRDSATGALQRVVEERDADESLRQIREVNSGVMAFDASWLWAHVGDLPAHDNGEYYLPDLVERALAEGKTIATLTTDEPAEALGVNTQAELARANQLAWRRNVARLMDEGVVVLDPATTYVESNVTVKAGTVIHPATHLQSRERPTRIGRDCVIGPSTTIVDSQIGDRSSVVYSVVEASLVDEDVQIGPFSHLRPGCHLESGVCFGNYAEAKNSRIRRDTQVHHFSYLGDADVGERVNIGAGTITCNYDGQAKHRTTIGNDVFVGSDSMLVAPIELGEASRTGAGSVVTHDVPSGTTVLGVPARQYRPRSESAETDGGVAPEQRQGA